MEDTEEEFPVEDESPSAKTGSLPGEDEEDPVGPFTYYDIKRITAAPVTSPSYTGIPDLLPLYYDCTKRGNLQMVDAKTLVFSSGNYIHFFNVVTRRIKYMRTVGGYGVGHIAFHPNSTHLVVAEKGFSPNIYVYEYPSLKLWRVLRGGADLSYAYVAFNPSGRLMASIATEPDYMLTVWNWRTETIILRTKAFSNDVFLVAFSPFTLGYLTTSGSGHIRFWKMARTFTGLKLQGALGRFGRTEVSTIEGLLQFPDTKVLTGCEWGNLLIWDAGLIKVEVTRRMGKPCHYSAVTQFLVEEGDLLSIGSDGYIKVWQLETLYTAEPSDEAGMFELEPLNEMYVGENAHLMRIVKSLDKSTPNLWYAQDYKGAIWALDLSFTSTSKPTEKILVCQSGAINAMDVSPVSYLAVTAANDATIRLYDLLARKRISERRFFCPVTAIAWMPHEFASKNNFIAAGFKDGTFRIVSIEQTKVPRAEAIVSFGLKACCKPHTSKVSCIAFQIDTRIIATGSDDRTVFFFLWTNDITPIGFVSVAEAVTSVCCSLPKIVPKTILITCFNGEVVRIDSPDTNKKVLALLMKKKTYLLDELEQTVFTFQSIKSRLRREERKTERKVQELARRQKEAEEAVRQLEEARRIARRRRKAEASSHPETPLGSVPPTVIGSPLESPSADHLDNIQGSKEELSPAAFMALSSKGTSGSASVEEEEEEEELYIPPSPSPIKFGFFSSKGLKFWLSMDGFDTGYLFEYSIVLRQSENEWGDMKTVYDIGPEPVTVFPLPQSDDVTLYSIAFSHDGHYSAMGFGDGMVRLYKLATPFVLTSQEYYWAQRIHDYESGAVTAVAFTYDQRFLITAGNDSGLFLLVVLSVTGMMPEEPKTKVAAELPSTSVSKADVTAVVEIVDPKHPSLEQQKQQTESMRFMKLVEKKRLMLQQHILQLQEMFQKILEHNKQLPENMKLQRKELTISQRLRKELMQEFAKMEQQTYDELAWEYEKHSLGLQKMEKRFRNSVEWPVLKVKSFKTSAVVSTYRIARLIDGINECLEEEEVAILPLERRPTIHVKPVVERPPIEEDKLRDLKTKSPVTTGLSLERQVQRVIKRIEQRKKAKALRHIEWEALMARKPESNKISPTVLRAVEDARNNMGDYSLKSSPDYSVPEHLRMTTKRKLKELLECVKMSHHYKTVFNEKVLALKNRKREIIKRMEWINNRLTLTQKGMQLADRKPIPSVPKLEPFEVPEQELQASVNNMYEALMKTEENKISSIHLKELATLKQNLSKQKTVSGSTVGEHDGSISLHDERGGSLISVEADNEAQDPDSELIAGQLNTNISPLEVKLHKLHLTKNLFEQDQLLEEVEVIINRFDADVFQLLEDKHRLNTSLKQGDIRQLCLYAELDMLRQFETQENDLLSKLNKKLEEKSEMEAKVQELTMRIETKRRDLDRLHEQEKFLLQELAIMLGEHNKFGTFLTKVYKKRVKRAKKREEGKEDEEEEESESDEDFDVNLEEDDEDEFVNDTFCPEGCDFDLFTDVLSLREKRLDVEEILSDDKKQIDALKKEIDSINKKFRTVDVALKSAQADFKKVQQEKQRRLNEIGVVVPLKISQIRYIVNGELATDVKPCLVFPAKGLKQLEDRIVELQSEKTSQTQKYGHNQRHHSRLQRECTLMNDKIQHLRSKCRELMIEKFGCIVNMDTLETMAVNRSLEEIKQRLKLTQMQQATDKVKWNKELVEAEEALQSTLQENTQHLLGLHQMLMEKHRMEQKMKMQQKNMSRDLLAEKTPTERQEESLRKLVEEQNREIQVLKKLLEEAQRKEQCSHLAMERHVHRYPRGRSRITPARIPFRDPVSNVSEIVIDERRSLDALQSIYEAILERVESGEAAVPEILLQAIADMSTEELLLSLQETDSLTLETTEKTTTSRKKFAKGDSNTKTEDYRSASEDDESLNA